MALQSSGAISLLDVQNEFGGSNPIGINEYYGVAAGVPSSGTISLYDFYGKSAYTWIQFSMGYRDVNTANNQDYFVGTTITPGSSASPATFIINFITLNPGYVQLYVGGSLSITFSGSQSNTSHVSYFGGSSLYFISYQVMDPYTSASTNIYVGGVEVFRHLSYYSPYNRD